jgi:hypothetical protein
MRRIVTWSSLVLGAITLGGAVGASAGWYYGTLRLRDFPDEAVQAAYRAGEGVSEDIVPRVLYTMVGGVAGSAMGYPVGLYVAILLERRRRDDA